MDSKLPHNGPTESINPFHLHSLRERSHLHVHPLYVVSKLRGQSKSSIFVSTFQGWIAWALVQAEPAQENLFRFLSLSLPGFELFMHRWWSGGGLLFPKKHKITLKVAGKAPGLVHLARRDRGRPQALLLLAVLVQHVRQVVHHQPRSPSHWREAVRVPVLSQDLYAAGLCQPSQVDPPQPQFCYRFCPDLRRLRCWNREKIENLDQWPLLTLISSFTPLRVPAFNFTPNCLLKHTSWECEPLKVANWVAAKICASSAHSSLAYPNCFFFFVHSKIRQGRKKKRQKVYQQNVATSILPRKKSEKHFGIHCKQYVYEEFVHKKEKLREKLCFVSSHREL